MFSHCAPNESNRWRWCWVFTVFDHIAVSCWGNVAINHVFLSASWWGIFHCNFEISGTGWDLTKFQGKSDKKLKFQKIRINLSFFNNFNELFWKLFNEKDKKILEKAQKEREILEDLKNPEISGISWKIHQILNSIEGSSISHVKSERKLGRKRFKMCNSTQGPTNEPVSLKFKRIHQ